MKNSIKAELAAVASAARISTLRNFLLSIHHIKLSDLQVIDLLSIIDSFYLQLYPKPKCSRCEDRLTLGAFASCRIES